MLPVSAVNGESSLPSFSDSVYILWFCREIEAPYINHNQDIVYLPSLKGYTRHLFRKYGEMDLADLQVLVLYCMCECYISGQIKGCLLEVRTEFQQGPCHGPHHWDNEAS